jgi:hypothetical protein
LENIKEIGNKNNFKTFLKIPQIKSGSKIKIFEKVPYVPLSLAKK